MPYYPKPFYQEPLARWYVQIAKKHIPLRVDPKPKRDKTGKPVPPKDVVERYHELMAGCDESRRVSPALARNPAVAAALDEFLECASRHKAPRTYAWYRPGEHQSGPCGPDSL